MFRKTSLVLISTLTAMLLFAGNARAQTPWDARDGFPGLDASGALDWSQLFSATCVLRRGPQVCVAQVPNPKGHRYHEVIHVLGTTPRNSYVVIQSISRTGEARQLIVQKKKRIIVRKK